jgi:hypothetical protein
MDMWKVGRLVGFTFVVTVMLAMVPADVLAQKKKKKDDTPQYPPAAEADYAALKSSVSGKIVTFEPGKTATFRVETSHQEPNPNYKPPSTNPKSPNYNAQAATQANLYKQYLKLTTQLQSAATAKTPAQAARAQANIQIELINIQGQLLKLAATNNDPNNQPFKTVTTTKDYDLDLEDKVVYRKTFLPAEYDDEGNIKKYTAEEKLALKTDDKRYKATADEVQSNQEATLFLTIPKKKSKSDEDSTPPEHPTVNKIVLTKEAPTVSTSPGDAPKKKKAN